ncbi:MAG: hypothetical protein ABR597_14480 [Bacteroidales bacterium]
MKKILLLCIEFFVGLTCHSQSFQVQASSIVFQTGFEEEKPVWDDYDDNSDVQFHSDPGPFNTAGNKVLRLAVPAGKGGGSDLVVSK